MKFTWSFLHYSTGHTVCVWSKSTKQRLQHRIAHYSLRTADVSPRSSPLRDVSREGTQLAKRLSIAMSEEGMRRWARRNSTCKTSFNGDERGETSAVRRLQHTHDLAPLRSKDYNLQVKLVLFSNNLRSLCKCIIHFSPNWVRRLKVHIISCLALKKSLPTPRNRSRAAFLIF